MTRAAIIVSCPKCGRSRLYGHACGHCGDPEPEAALIAAANSPVERFQSIGGTQSPANVRIALYGHPRGCTGYVSRNPEGAATCRQ